MNEHQNAESATTAPQEEEADAEERSGPPIDEDVTGQVNAAVPPRDDES